MSWSVALELQWCAAANPEVAHSQDIVYTNNAIQKSFYLPVFHTSTLSYLHISYVINDMSINLTVDIRHM